MGNRGSTKVKQSLRRAIDGKCRECLFSPDAPGRWREQIERCTAPDCPLYAVRPRAWRASTAKQAKKAELRGAGREILSEAGSRIGV